MSEASTSPTESSDNPEAFKRRLSRARHDLRSPLCHILGFTEILLEDAEDHARNDLLPQLRAIELATNEALERINEALNVEGLTITPPTSRAQGRAEESPNHPPTFGRPETGSPHRGGQNLPGRFTTHPPCRQRNPGGHDRHTADLETLAQRPQLSAQEDFNTVVYSRSNHPDTEFETVTKRGLWLSMIGKRIEPFSIEDSGVWVTASSWPRAESRRFKSPERRVST